MTASLDTGGVAILRRLAQLSMLFALSSLLATAVALMLLPNAVAAGQWIVIGAGTIVSVSAFVFGMLTSLRKPLARRLGFAVVAVVFPTAVLFGLLAYVVPESAWVFGTWTIVLLGYSAFVTQRLVRWPSEEGWDRPKSSLAIFISYRRQDSQDTVGRIHDQLCEVFDEKRIFLDVDRQAAGDDYRKVIDDALDRAEVVLAVIGEQWLTIEDREGQRRLDDPEDMVRIELETALHRNVRLIPVLLEAANMPAAEDVPASLQALCFRMAVRVRPDPDFNPDMQRLVLALSGEEEPAPEDSPIADGS